MYVCQWLNKLLIKINRIFLANDTNKISKYVLTGINYLKNYFLFSTKSDQDSLPSFHNEEPHYIC